MQTLERRLFILLLLCAILVVTRGPNSMGGDAPHYLALSHSLVHDFDLELSNQYAPTSDYIFRLDVTEAHVTIGRKGGLYPFHHTGLSIAAAPFFFIAELVSRLLPERFLRRVRSDRMRACRDILSVFMAALFAWTAVLTARCCCRLTTSDSPCALAVFQAFASPPLLSMSILLFTEIPAAFLSVVFVLESLKAKPSPIRLILPLSLLPWLNLRYSVISVAGLVWALGSLAQRGAFGWRPLGRLLWIPLLSFGLLSLENWWMFESLLPWAQFDTGFPLTAANLPQGLLGQLVDRDFGLLPLAPFWVVALAVLAKPKALGRGYVLFAAAALVSTWIVASFNPMWWGGYSPSARFLVPTLPILVPALAEGYRRILARGKEWILYVSLGYSIVMTLTLILQAGRLWSDPETGLGIMAALGPLHDHLPSVYQGLPPGFGALFIVLLWAVLAWPVLGRDCIVDERRG